MRQKSFELGNRPGKLLAWQVKKRLKERQINKVISQGETLETEEKIKRGFLNYFTKLYTKGKDPMTPSAGQKHCPRI